MPGTFSDSWKLTKTSFGLIRQDRALLVFPLIAGLATIAIFVLLIAAEYWFVAPVILGGGSLTSGYEALAIVLFLAAYLASTFVAVYCTAALVGAATLKLNGQQPTAADGWRVARSRWKRLLAWALITATVGLVIQAIQRRIGGLGGAVVGLVGGATWAIVTYFIIPILLFEDQGAWASLKRSGHLFISTFGRSLVSNLALGLLITAGVLVAFFLGIAGIYLLVSGSLAFGLTLLGVAIALGVIVALIGSAAEGILRAALYRYATTGKIDPDLMPKGYAGALPSSPGAPLA